MARSNLEQAAAQLLSAWGDGVAPASNCTAYVNELRKVYAAEVEAREEARLDLYRAFVRNDVCVKPDDGGAFYSHEVRHAAAVVSGTLNGDAGAWVDLSVFIPAGAVGDDEGEF